MRNECLVAYTSPSAHGCVAQAFDLAGIGKGQLQIIPTNESFQMDSLALNERIIRDLADGKRPFFVAATAGTVDHGVVDPLRDIAKVCKEYNLWFHIDGAFGSMLKLSKRAHLVDGLELAESLALDFHKWLQVPYDCAMFLCNGHRRVHHDTFAAHVGYLRRESDGIAGGSPWPCDFGPDLSRGFRAYKAYITLAAVGTKKLGQMIDTCIDIAHYAQHLIDREPHLELACPVVTTVVAFRFTSHLPDNELDNLNTKIAVMVQEAGQVAPSTNVINKKLYIRARIINHRTLKSDVETLVTQVDKFGKAVSKNEFS